MARLESLTTEFVHFMPKDLLPGILYVSLEFEVAIHLCACNSCGGKTVTPLRGPYGWGFSVDSENRVTLEPSIGNFQFPCKSHYFIRANQVIWL